MQGFKDNASANGDTLRRPRTLRIRENFENSPNAASPSLLVHVLVILKKFKNFLWWENFKQDSTKTFLETKAKFFKI